MAFSIFEKLCEKFQLKSDIATRAFKLVKHDKLSYERLLQELTDEKSRLEGLYLENKRINRDLLEKQNSMEAALKMEKKRLMDQYESKLKKTLEKAYFLLESTRLKEKTSKKAFSQKSLELKKELNEEKIASPEEKGSDLNPPQFDAIQEGQWYHSKKLGEMVKVVKINPRKKEVLISRDNFSLWCGAESLGIIKENITPKITLNIDRTSVLSTEFDCRGMRLDEFEVITRGAVLDLQNGEIPYLKIIHGHGEGVLKTWLRNFLREHDDLTFGPDEGNDGVTKIELKRRL
jgi:DNA mismatch repair protein MutS2